MRCRICNRYHTKGNPVLTFITSAGAYDWLCRKCTAPEEEEKETSTEDELTVGEALESPPELDIIIASLEEAIQACRQQSLSEGPRTGEQEGGATQVAADPQTLASDAPRGLRIDSSCGGWDD